ncbi:hypothetical protein AB833_30265 [Chromatiales bacterium (ex Bugula neritina AB1)]|nr:hypothetical protein AB833_30265 [Chromatiales bacterium (ex Bugula neritina AB1)]
MTGATQPVIKTPVETIRHKLITFVTHLRVNGFEITADDIKTAHELSCTPYFHDRKYTRFALRSVFCKSKSNWKEFSALFNAYWLMGIEPEDIHEEAQLASAGGRASGLSYFSESEAQRTATYADKSDSPDTTSGGASDARVLAQRDFRFVFNARDMRNVEHLVDDLARQVQRRTRRRTHCSRKRGRLDPRRMTRNNLGHGGWPFELSFQRKRKTPARFLLLLDVSQSMEIYSYLFLRFARGLLQAFSDTDAYAFHTDLVPIGVELKDKNTDRLEEKMKGLSSGWLGGTRIADSLTDFNRHFAQQAANRHTIAFIFSDGYDSSEPEQLVEQVLSLKQRCRKIVWINPLLGRSSQATSSLAVDQCMQAVIPHLDIYTSAHSLDSLRELAPAFSIR